MSTEPTMDQLQLLQAGDSQEPIRMINLLKFKAIAEYEDNTKGDGATGLEAYMRYGAILGDGVSEGILKEVGAKIVYAEPVSQAVIGAANATDYDIVAIVEYPNRDAFLGMINSERYVEAHAHRSAGLEHQLLFCCSGGKTIAL